MKTFGILLVAMLTFNLSSFAQQQGGDRRGGQRGGMRPQITQNPSEKAKQNTERLVKFLELTTEQTAKIKAINEKSAIAVKKIQDEAKAKIEANQKETSSNIEALLTPKQKEKYKMVKNRMSQSSTSRGQHSSVGRAQVGSRRK